MNTLTRIAFVTALSAATVFGFSDTLNFYSGMGTAVTDPNVTTLKGSTTGAFSPLTGTDFTQLSTGANAFILSGYAHGWLHTLSGGPSPLTDDSLAKWIGVDSTGWNNSYTSHSGLYDFHFSLAQATHAATLDLNFSVDDQLGDANNAGIFIDSTGIPQTASNVLWDGKLGSWTNLNLGPLSAGAHDLVFNVVNSHGGPSGIIYSGQIHTQAAPEPFSLGALAIGVVGLARRRRK